MRTIIKGPEPHSLTQHRLTPGASYDNYPDKDALRASLVSEQRGLCCYCLSRIQPQNRAMRVEHWHCQDNYPAEQLYYRNILGACSRSEGQPWKHQHCDVRKRNSDLSRNPADLIPRVEELVGFHGDGRIFSNNPTFDLELNAVLNLNEAFLKNRRKAVLDAFKDTLVKRGHLSRATLLKLVQDWNGESHTGELREFCQIVVYWIRKRLARA